MPNINNNRAGNPIMLPSTYQQVIENMKNTENIDERITALETEIDASRVKSINGSMLDISVIPPAAMERLYTISTLDILNDKHNVGYPTDVSNGDTIQVDPTGSDPNAGKMYFIIDDTKLGTSLYTEGLREYASGNSTTVNGHTVNIDVPADAVFTDTITCAYCETDENTKDKIARCDGYTLRSGNWIQFILKTSNNIAANLTLDINNTGAVPIYINDTISSSSNYILNAGAYFMFYGEKDGNVGYYINTNGKMPNIDIPDVMVGATETVNGKAGLVPAPLHGEQNKVLSGAGTWVRHPNVKIEASQNQPTDLETGDFWIKISS